MTDIPPSTLDPGINNPPLTPHQSSDVAEALSLVPATPKTIETAVTPGEPVIVAGRMMRGRKARVMLSSCECGMDILDDDKRDDSTTVICCHTRGCETVWVC